MRRKPATTSSEMIKTMIAATGPDIVPPNGAHLIDGAKVFWDELIKIRAKVDWEKSDLMLLAQLANVQYEIFEQSKIIREEGHVLTNRFGDQLVNPRVTMLEKMTTREMALMRSLRIGGMPAGEKRDFAKRAELQKQTEKIAKDLLTEGSLLA